jgi:hypothetical protein
MAGVVTGASVRGLRTIPLQAASFEVIANAAFPQGDNAEKTSDPNLAPSSIFIDRTHMPVRGGDRERERRAPHHIGSSG